MEIMKAKGSALKTFWVRYRYTDDFGSRYYQDKIDATDALDAIARVRAIMARDAMPIDQTSDFSAQLYVKEQP